MAQSGRIRSLQNFICRSCRHTLSQPLRQSRQFSNTATRSKTIPSFTPTSNSELDSLFFDWRERVFTPSALPKHQRDLVYKKKHKPLLDNESGVMVTMSDGEEVRLEPRELYESPPLKPALKTVVRILESEDGNIQAWENLIPFLEGLHMSGYKLPREWLEQVTRKANEADRAGLIRRCAEMAQRTGMKLSYEGVTKEMMIGYHNRAIEALIGSDEAAARPKADHFSKAQALLELMGSEVHRPRSSAKYERDMKRDPLVLGTLLELGAIKIMTTSPSRDGKEDTSTPKLLTSYVRQLLEKRESITTPDKPSTSGASKPSQHNTSNITEGFVALEHGIRLTLALPKENLQITAQEREALDRMMTELQVTINRNLKVIKDEAQGKPRRSIIMADKVKEADQNDKLKAAL